MTRRSAMTCPMRRLASTLVRGRWLLALPVVVLSACSSEHSGGQVQINEAAGLELYKPGFLLSKSIDETRVEARVSVTADGNNQPVVELTSPPGDTAWHGEVHVPEGSDATIDINWVETGVSGLPDELSGELLLASYSLDIEAVNANEAVAVELADYVLESSEEDPRPDLDLDEDGFGNLYERVAETDPNDDLQKPTEVLINYYPDAPRIDGHFDDIWNEAQFVDYEKGDLLVDKVLFDDNVIQDGEADRRYRWGAMHDGESLYIMVFAEKEGAQTPFGDSEVIYDDDAIDIFWDGDNSKGSYYDKVDDFHAIIALLSSTGNENKTGRDDTRFKTGDRSTSIDVSAFEFAVCLCNATDQQQVYEVKLNLAAARIPIDERFGLDIQLNNDVNGGLRDAKWAWYNDTGKDDTWRYPNRMGTARLAPVP